MARRPRIFVPGYPHHIVQLGHDHNAVFIEPTDYEYYLANLIEWKSHYDVAVYAFCLMTNHIHLILVPLAEGRAISGLMRRLSAQQGQRVNRLERRIGSLWSGRFKSSVIDTDRYLMNCLRYVELNPVQAGMVARPEEYRWSSYAQHIGLCDQWVEPDPVTMRLGSTPAERCRAYAKYVKKGVSPTEREFIRNAVRRNQLTGGDRFVDEIERRTGIRVETRGPGRPKK